MGSYSVPYIIKSLMFIRVLVLFSEAQVTPASVVPVLLLYLYYYRKPTHCISTTAANLHPEP